MVQRGFTHYDKVPFLKTDQGRYNFCDSYLVNNAELQPEFNVYVHPTSSHNLQRFQLRPCAGSHRISKISTVNNNNLLKNSSTHSSIEKTIDSRVKPKIITVNQQSTILENQKELKSRSCLRRWKVGRPCNIWPKCTNTSGFAFVIQKDTSQDCPGTSLPEKQQNTSRKSTNTACFAQKFAKATRNTSKTIYEKRRKATPKSTNTSRERIKYDGCAAKVSKKVTFDLTNTKSKSNENFILNKQNSRKYKNSVRTLKCNFALDVNKGIFSKFGQPPEEPAGILRNRNETWGLKSNYGCSDFRERLMLEVQRDSTRNILGFPLKDSLESYNMYPFIPSYQAY